MLGNGSRRRRTGRWWVALGLAMLLLATLIGASAIARSSKGPHRIVGISAKQARKLPRLQRNRGSRARVPRAVIRKARRRAREFERRRRTAKARRARQRSRVAFRDMTRAEAVALAEDKYPHVVDAPDWKPVPASDRIVDYRGEDAAVVDLGSGRGRVLMQSSVPLRAKGQDGDLRPVDLTLKDRGVDLRHRVRLTMEGNRGTTTRTVALPDIAARRGVQRTLAVPWNGQSPALARVRVTSSIGQANVNLLTVRASAGESGSSRWAVYTLLVLMSGAVVGLAVLLRPRIQRAQPSA